MTITEKEYLGESTPAADTLKDATKSKGPKKTDLEVAMDAMMRLSDDEKKQVSDKCLGLEKHASDADGSRSRKSLKPKGGTTIGAIDMPTLTAAVKRIFANESEEMQTNLAELLSTTVGALSCKEVFEAVLGSDDPLFSLLFVDDTTAERIEELTDRSSWLSEQCEIIDAENQELREDLMLRQIAEMQQIKEEVLIHADPFRPSRRTKTSRLESDLYEPMNEDGLWAEQHGTADPKMRLYENAVRRSVSK
jgi:hypothetical protein